MEEWKDIANYEGLYQVSNFGEVKSLNYNKTKKEKILKQRKLPNGYCRITLVKSKKKSEFYIHSLVAQTFISNPHNYKEINHINEIKDDNRVGNLEWCSHKYNLNYGNRNKKYSKPIIQYNLNKNIIKEYDSATIASKITSINRNCIIACCRGKQKTAGNFLWKYKEGDLIG